MADSYSYDGYGVMLSDNSRPEAQAQTSLLYSGEQFDSTLDQYYLRARYYNQSNGTFNRVDPFSGNLQDPQSLHKYLYCHANPVNGIDPSGMFAALAGVGVAAGIRGISRAEYDVPKALVINKIVSTLILAVMGIQVAIGISDIAEAIERHRDVQIIQDYIELPWADFSLDVLEDLLNRDERRKGEKKCYLHYSFKSFWKSLMTGLAPAGVFNEEGSYATRDIYPTGWSAKWFLALDGEPRDAVYVVFPRTGFGPTSESRVKPKYGMGGGGYQYIFAKGSGGPGTVFGPIPIPKGFEGDWNNF